MNFVNILNIWKFYSVHGSVSGLYVLKCFGGIVLIYLLRLNILHIYCLIKWLVVYKCDYRFHIKQVIISCEFCQHFKYLEVLQCLWMSEWFTCF